MAKKSKVTARIGGEGLSSGKQYELIRETPKTFYIINNMNKIKEYPKENFHFGIH